MKFIEPPLFSDLYALNKLSKNKKACSYPRLSYITQNINDQYVSYINYEGNPWQVKPIGVNEPVKSQLIYHYDHPPKVLSQIDLIRKKLSPDICPVCGSLNPETVDHVLPKDVYPEYAFFTLNLVPACSCNTHKGEIYQGTNVGERGLHPYFDKIMLNRIVRCLISENLETPSITLEICCGDIPEKPAVEFHINNIVNKTNIINVMNKNWANLLRKPYTSLYLLPKPLNTEQQLTTAINHTLNRYDTYYETPNNWFSIFFAGVYSNPNVVKWLFQHILDLNGDTISTI